MLKLLLAGRILDKAEQAEKDQRDRYNPVEAKSRDLRLARYRERTRKKAIKWTLGSLFIAAIGWTAFLMLPRPAGGSAAIAAIVLTMISAVPFFCAVWAMSCFGGPSSEEVLARRYCGMRAELDVAEGEDPTKKPKKPRT